MPYVALPKPSPPSDLSTSQQLWQGLVADLRAIGHDAEVDLTLLGDVLRARERLAQVSDKLAADGQVVTGSRGQLRPHPLLDVEQRLRREVAVGFDRLGLSAARRDYTVSVANGGRIERSG